MNPMNYQFLNHIDAPWRCLTLTIDELVIAVTSALLLILCNQKILVAILGFSLLGGLRHIKKGEGPKVLLMLAYWYLPSALTQFLLPAFPPSHHRVWVA